MVTVYENLQNRREVLTASGEVMSRSDAEALGYTVARYAELVPASERIATTHPEHFDLVRVPPFGAVVTAATAKAGGFVVSDVEAPPRAAMRDDPQSSWRSAIMALSEARDRTSATAELLTTQSHLTLSVEAARAMLRGLPTEHEEEEQTEVTDHTDPRAARLAEIERSAAAFNKGRGYKSAPKATLRPAQERTDIDSAKLHRLSEIRLTGLCANGRENSEEAKILRNALDTHHRVGTPLNRALAQHGFDAATLLPKS